MPRQSILVPCAAFEAHALCFPNGRRMDALERHPAHEIFYQTAGVSRCRAGEKTHTLCAGALMLLPAGVPHRFTAPQDGPVRGIELHFTDAFLRPLLAACPREALYGGWPSGEGAALTAPWHDEPFLAAIPERLAHLAEAPAAETALPECRLLLGALLLALGPQLAAAGQKTGTAAQQLAEAARLWMTAHYAEPCSLPALAAQMGVSPAHLSRAFKQAAGVGPNAYLGALRVRKAQEYLLAGEQDLAAVARRCGFGTVAQFRRVFKAVCGVTPGRYRKRCRQQNAPAAAGA